mmetsp:Transcript_56390/g.159876  ORF Transcript_56390/g.159876 Transcript_56390/m.159876 type:complete len:270 (+) Transcript_56390:194-1003(+)
MTERDSATCAQAKQAADWPWKLKPPPRSAASALAKALPSRTGLRVQVLGPRLADAPHALPRQRLAVLPAHDRALDSQLEPGGAAAAGLGAPGAEGQLQAFGELPLAPRRVRDGQPRHNGSSSSSSSSISTGRPSFAAASGGGGRRGGRTRRRRGRRRRRPKLDLEARREEGQKLWQTPVGRHRHGRAVDVAEAQDAQAHPPSSPLRRRVRRKGGGGVGGGGGTTDDILRPAQPRPRSLEALCLSGNELRHGPGSAPRRGWSAALLPSSS